MPKIDIAKATVRTKSIYPEPWRAITAGREKAVLGDVAGLTQFGVNLTRLKPGLTLYLGIRPGQPPAALCIRRRKVFCGPNAENWERGQKAERRDAENKAT